MENTAGDIVLALLAIQNQIKIYHWQTYSYARHKSSDELFSSLVTKIDKFVEVLQGTWNIRVQLNSQTSLPLLNMNDVQAVKLLQIFKEYLTEDLSSLIPPIHTDLFNIRDEILAKVNRTLYLFTFQK